MNASTYKTTVTGLDLGSAYTKIAAVDKGTVQIITNEANLRQTPTLVAYGPNQRLLGENAQAKLKSNYANTISAPHRYLGFSQSQFITNEGRLATSKPKQQNGVLLFGVNQLERKQKLNAQQITAAFLTKINQIVEMNKMNNKFMVLAVPDYLTHHERKALINVLQIAKETISNNYGVQLVNESTAIGLDYGFYKKKDFKEKEEDAQVTLFIDFGHSKLSAYAIKFTQKYQKVILQHHRRQLGCRDMDALMYQFYSGIFQGQNKDLQIGVKQSKKATLKLLQNIEKQRRLLSGISEYDFNIDCLLQQKDLSYTMTRNQFEQISQPVLQQIANFFEQVRNILNQIGVPHVNVELVGGGSRIPCFIQTISNVFNLEPSRTLNSSQCIARGAALFSAMQSNLFRTQPYYSVELSPYELMCSWRREDQNMQIQQNSVYILGRGQTMYGEKHVQLMLKASNRKMLFQISDSNIPLGLETRICTFKVQFDSGSEEQTHHRFKLGLKFDDNKILSGLAVSQVKQKEEPIKIYELTFIQKTSNQQLRELIVKQKEDIAKDLKILAYYQRKNNFQSKLYTLRQNLAAFVDNHIHKNYIRPERVEQVFKYFSDLQDNFQNISIYDQQIKRAQTVVKQLQFEAQLAKNKYLKVQEQLEKFRQHIQAIVSGKNKQVKLYPAEEVQRIKDWITNTLAQLTNQPKNQQLCTNLQQISNMRKILAQKIDQYQAEQLKRQKQEHKRYHNMRQQQSRNFYRDPFQNSPFGGSYGYEPPRTRGRTRNSSFVGYNPFGFF